MEKEEKIQVLRLHRRVLALAITQRKKTILFSLDALLAVLISVMLLAAIFSYSNKSYEPDYTELDLYHMSADSVAVLKASGELSYSATMNSTVNIYPYLNLMPSQVCLMLKIYNKSHYPIMNAAKGDCLTVSGEPAVIYESPFIANDNIYTARIIAWYK